MGKKIRIGNAIHGDICMAIHDHTFRFNYGGKQRGT